MILNKKSRSESRNLNGKLNSKVGITTRKVDEILKQKGLSHQNLCVLLSKSKGYISRIFKGDQLFSENIINDLLPILEISRKEFESWIIADKYPKKLLELAIQVKKSYKDNDKYVLTIKIDEILASRNISRTTLAKQIKYNQSTLNKILTKQRTMSKDVREKISQFLEISQDDISSWIIADKYDLELLEMAWDYNE